MERKEGKRKASKRTKKEQKEELGKKKRKEDRKGKRATKNQPGQGDIAARHLCGQLALASLAAELGTGLKVCIQLSQLRAG